MISMRNRGCELTRPDTDYAREMVPLLVSGRGFTPGALGRMTSFTYLARLVRDWLGVGANASWAR